MRTALSIVAAIWIVLNLYVWGVMSVPPALAGRLPAGWRDGYAYQRAVLTKVFYRPYVWSFEGG